MSEKLLEATVKPVLSGHSKIDKTKVLKTKGSLMKVESIAEEAFLPGNPIQNEIIITLR